MTSSRAALARHSFLYSAGLMAENLGALVLGFVVARVLGPTIQGIWQTARLFATYSDLATLGQLLGMRREAAVAAGAGDGAEVARQRDSGFVWASAAFLFAATAIALYAVSAELNPLLRRAVLAVAAAVAIQGVSSFLNLWHKATERFEVLALASVVSAVVSLATVGLVLWMRLEGLLLGYVAAAAAVALTLLAGFRGPLAFRFDAGAWRRAFRVGFPLFLITVSALLFATLDRLLVLALMGFTDMGFYSVSTMFFMPVQVAMSSVSVVLLPRACRRFGEHGSADSLSGFFLGPLSVLMVGLAGAATLMALLVPALVDLLLPRYQAGVLPAQIVLMGLPYGCAPGFCENILQAANRTWWQAGVSFVASLCKLGFVWVFWVLGMRLSGVAAAAALGLVAQFMLLVAVTGLVTRSGWRARAMLMGESVSASLLCALVWWYVRDVRVVWQAGVVSWAHLLAMLAVAILPLGFSAVRLYRMARR